MSYKRTIWENQFRDGTGAVIQEGTPVDAEHLNNMEEGIENAVSKDGGDIINDELKFKNTTETKTNGGRIAADDAGTSVTSFDNLDNEGGDRQTLTVNTAKNSDKNTAVQVTIVKDGATETFNVLHSGNKDLITPEDIGAAKASHGTHVGYSSTAPFADGTANTGSATTVARSDHRHPTDTTRAPMYDYGTTDLTAGVSPLATGKLYFVYE